MLEVLWPTTNFGIFWMRNRPVLTKWRHIGFHHTFPSRRKVTLNPESTNHNYNLSITSAPSYKTLYLRDYKNVDCLLHALTLVDKQTTMNGDMNSRSFQCWTTSLPIHYRLSQPYYLTVSLSVLPFLFAQMNWNWIESFVWFSLFISSLASAERNTKWLNNTLENWARPGILWKIFDGFVYPVRSSIEIDCVYISGFN